MRAAAIALVLLLGAADAPPYQSSPPRRTVVEDRDFGPWAGPFRARLIGGLMRDFGEKYLYRERNAALPPPRPGERRVVFLGDSITDGWNLAAAFPGRPFVNRGIGSQVTAQMLVRFRDDVVALRPMAVVILAGINDVAGFLQVETPDGIVANVTAMADVARANNIAVVLCALLPVRGDQVHERPPAVLRAVNDRLAALARARGYGFADYWAATADGEGMLDVRLTRDGLHPNAAGYARMAGAAAGAVERMLARPRPGRSE